MMAVFIPAPASRAASDGPAWPVPMMIASYFVVIGFISLFSNPRLPVFIPFVPEISFHTIEDGLNGDNRISTGQSVPIRLIRSIRLLFPRHGNALSD
jgi:hypothetical protein